MTTISQAQHDEAGILESGHLQALAAIVGEAHVLTGFADRLAYARDRWPLANLAFRAGELPAPLPAAVVQPGTIADVAGVLRWAAAHGVAVVPYGLGSGVLGGALASAGAITLDLRRLDAVVSMHREDCLVTVGAGINGGHLEAALNAEGLTTGHYPQSLNISTVGGWIVCRGAGQGSSRYGSIETMVAGIKVVLPSGDLLEVRPAPRRSAGPGLIDLFLGSEGTLGVIVEATLRVWPLPEHESMRSFVFPDFAAGLRALRRITQAGVRPAIARLYDESESEYRLCDAETRGNRALCLFVFAGLPGIARAEEQAAAEMCVAEGAVDLGPAPVVLWKRLRFDSYSARHMAAGKLMDTIEVAAPWSVLPSMHAEILERVRGLDPGIHFGAHWSHVYVDGACMYMSLVFPDVPDPDQRASHRRAWEIVMQAVRHHGGSFAHHHGVGLHRGEWMPIEVGEAGMKVLRSVKAAVDPQGLLNPGRLGLSSARPIDG